MDTIRKPEVIEAEIAKLKAELADARADRIKAQEAAYNILLNLGWTRVKDENGYAGWKKPEESRNDGILKWVYSNITNTYYAVLEDSPSSLMYVCKPVIGRVGNNIELGCLKRGVRKVNCKEVPFNCVIPKLTK